MSELTPHALLAVLADGRPHSGEELARAFGVSRAAVWKQVAKLGDWQLDVRATPGRGYRLAQPVDLLDRTALEARLAAAPVPVRLELFTVIESTNRYLLDRPPPPGTLAACVAEYQTAGRGRRGRSWRVPFGAGLCLSASWQFERMPAELAALTLAAGVTARRVLRQVAGVDVALKWPNDLVWDDRKLGGILLEMSGEAQGGCHVVIGIGLNVDVPRDVLARVSDWPRGAVDLAEATAGRPPGRNELAAELIAAFGELCRDYARTGFAPYRAAWRRADHLDGKRVTLDDPAGAVVATACGIDADGALLVETASGERRRVIAGDVSVRP